MLPDWVAFPHWLMNRHTHANNRNSHALRKVRVGLCSNDSTIIKFIAKCKQVKSCAFSFYVMIFNNISVMTLDYVTTKLFYNRFNLVFKRKRHNEQALGDSDLEQTPAVGGQPSALTGSVEREREKIVSQVGNYIASVICPCVFSMHGVPNTLSPVSSSRHF